MARGQTYKARSQILASLGYARYADYLKSATWHRIRRKVFRKNAKCVVCGTKATEVHHRSYSTKVLTGKKIGSLVPICREHHEAIEFDGERKRTIAEANQHLDLLISAAKPVQTPTKDRPVKVSRSRQKRRENARAAQIREQQNKLAIKKLRDEENEKWKHEARLRWKCPNAGELANYSRPKLDGPGLSAFVAKRHRSNLEAATA